MTITNTIEIAAPVERVWALTIDIEGWPRISPKTITSVTRLASGEPIAIGTRARVKQPGQRPLVWTVTEYVPNRTFVWGTRTMGITMVASHELTAIAGGTRNTLSIELSGRGAGLFARLFGTRVLGAITHENEGFKRVAEAG